MPPSQAAKKVEIIKANRLLQAKVGTGKINPELIRRAQVAMNENDIDFTPLAQEFLQELAEGLHKAKVEDRQSVHKDAITNSIMQLKANASTFHYNLVGNLADTMLNFIERVEELDPDVVTIADAHYKTLNVLITKKMKGDGGVYGKELQQELANACQRYFTKHDKKSA